MHVHVHVFDDDRDRPPNRLRLGALCVADVLGISERDLELRGAAT